MSSIPAQRRTAIVILLGGLTAIGPFCIDTYLPAFGVIALGLDTTVARVGLSLSSYFVGICLGQLAYGPILDRFGRKLPLLVGMAIMILASMGAALSPGIGALITWRFLQALGACSGIVAARALVMDFFPNDAPKIFSMLMLVMGLAPILAPSMGGWLALKLGWRAIFGFHTLLALTLATSVWRLLPWDRRNDARFSLHPWQVLGGYAALLKEGRFIFFCLTGACALAGLMSYISGAPFVYMKLFGLTEAQFARVFGLNALALIVGSQLNVPLGRRLQPWQVLRLAMAVLLLFALILLVGAGWMGLAVLPSMVLVSLFLLAYGMASPNAMALSLRAFREKAGIASALNGSVQMGTSALASALVAGFHDGSIRPMALGMTCCAGLGFLLLLGAPRPVVK